MGVWGWGKKEREGGSPFKTRRIRGVGGGGEGKGGWKGGGVPHRGAGAFLFWGTGAGFLHNDGQRGGRGRDRSGGIPLPSGRGGK